MYDPLDELLAESEPSGDNAREARRKAFEDALDRVMAVAKCVPDDKEDLAEEKKDWAVELEGSLVHLQLINLIFPS
jgi:hypothetical protein